MKLAIAELNSTSAYSQSRFYDVPKEERELPQAYEERTWRERCHVSEKGQLFIPPMAFANSLKEAARYLAIAIPGKARTTFTKHFEAGVLVTEPLYLPVFKEKVQGEWVFVPSDGRRGGGRRVQKCFPIIPSWEGEVNFYMLDDIITEDVFRHVLTVSGTLIGIGRFRPKNMGYYGRFELKSLKFGKV